MELQLSIQMERFPQTFDFKTLRGFSAKRVFTSVYIRRSGVKRRIYTRLQVAAAVALTA